MMMRDTRKNHEYFEKYIYGQKDRIAKFEDVKSKLVDESKKKECDSILASLLRDLFKAQYSIGSEATELNKTFEEYIEKISQEKELSYSECLDIISIAIILDYDINYIKNIVEDKIQNDALIDLLLGKADNNNLLFPDYSSVFYNFLTDRIAIEEFVAYIENDWYNSCKDMYWYNTENNPHDTYTGYWCWLAGACLKVKKCELDRAYNYIPKS